jgi:predicted DNA-binding protein YlxM (UPF0122 family)
MKTLDKTTIEKIIKDYEEGELKVKEIATKYHISLGTLYKAIGDRRRNPNDVRLEKNKKDENLQNAINEYINTYISVDEICKKYNITKTRLLDNCKYRRGNANKGRKYNLNEDKIFNDSREKFYWIGFIAADGCIADNRTLAIELKSIDKKHLQKFANFLETNKPIKDRINNLNVECSRITIHSVNIVNELAKYNVVSNKSKIFTIPVEKIPKEYIYDFVRGIIDGDGCIRINNHQQISLSFCSGNFECCKQLRDILGIDNKIKKDISSETWSFQVTGNIKAKAILDRIYENSNEEIRLDRKYNIYKTLN